MKYSIPHVLEKLILKLDRNDNPAIHDVCLDCIDILTNEHVERLLIDMTFEQMMIAPRQELIIRIISIDLDILTEVVQDMAADVTGQSLDS